MGIGDWGLGIGEWGLGAGGLAPTPHPQSHGPTPRPPVPVFCAFFFSKKNNKKIKNK